MTKRDTTKIPGALAWKNRQSEVIEASVFSSAQMF